MKIIQISKHTKPELTENIINILNKYEVIKIDNNFIIMNDNDAKSASEEILECYNNITKTSKKGWGIIEFGEADMIDNPRYATVEYVDKKFDELSKRIDALQNETPNWFKSFETSNNSRLDRIETILKEHTVLLKTHGERLDAIDTRLSKVENVIERNNLY